ncbi:hypothetical protein ACLOAU_22605 [Niabella sp. CJ426]|uniref:hypothetical protein n=1 Tax=Niabella sp. CJ426 TaxID=3393740 RepID=UPI003D05040A
MKFQFAILFVIAVYTSTQLLSQPSNNIRKSEKAVRSFKCYDDRLDTSDVFTKTEITPKYKGRGGFESYLTERLSSSMLLSSVSDKLFTDTVQVKFVLKPDSLRMSSVACGDAKNSQFKDQLIQAIKESACSWIPGGFSGREVKSWVILNIYYTVDRKRNNLSLNAGYEMANKWSPRASTWND